MEGTGEQRRSISDEVGSRITYSTFMQALCLAWLLPAVLLIWTGFAAIGLRSLTPLEIASSVERVQAMVVLLSIFSLPVGCSWAMRRWEHVPSLAVLRSQHWWSHPLTHLGSLFIATVSLAGAQLFPSIGESLSWLAAAAGFHAGMLAVRWLHYAPLGRGFPVTVFVAAVVGQDTIGWMHIIQPDGALAALLVVQGLGLAWAGLASARVIGAVGPPIAVSGPQFVVAEQTQSDGGESTVDLISPVPTLQSLPEPVAGR